ncbi:urease accessory protein UreE [Helicobacter trogontum]|uniref:Urease accessory protein UreE n=1 Tax=Helicobacter trogontum TaxID=50960 RepID=A0A4U8TEG9_9HELI|nr:urease accessory protein UreE [Helicobacter trogontum]MDY5185004.1 urease accessory protein UreE [Helicobacter trogontum]TLD98441.1 urease accessory protein UreE [Helicobacter trogontum]
MLVTQILGNLKDMAHADILVDFIFIEWFDTRKRIARYTSAQGKDIALRFEKPLMIGLNHGDIVFRDKEHVIAVSIVPTQILSIYVKTELDIARLCYEIGNYHLPLFLGESAFHFRTPYEKPLQRLLDKYGIFYREEKAVLDSKDRLQASFMAVEPKLQLGTDFKVIVNGK